MQKYPPSKLVQLLDAPHKSIPIVHSSISGRKKSRLDQLGTNSEDVRNLHILCALRVLHARFVIFYSFGHICLTSSWRQQREMTKFEVYGGSQHKTLKVHFLLYISNPFMPVKCLDSKFSFYILNDLKKFFYVTKNVNLCFGVTSSLRPRSLTLIIYQARENVLKN